MSPEPSILTPDGARRARADGPGPPSARRAVPRISSSRHETAALGMWVFLATEVMFFGTPVSRRGRLPLPVSGGLREGQRAAELDRSAASTRSCSLVEQPDHGAGGPLRQARPAQAGGVVPVSDGAARPHVPRAQRARVLPRLSGELVPGLELRCTRNGPRQGVNPECPRQALSAVLLDHDRHCTPCT